METTAHLTAQSLFAVYKQLPEDAQQAFKKLLDNEIALDYINAEWLSYSADILKETWETPEEDYRDELYAKQHTDH